MAPQHPFPAGADDCVQVTKWVIEHASSIGGDSSRVALVGDSAGANLAAVTILRIRQEHPDLSLSLVGQVRKPFSLSDSSLSLLPRHGTCVDCIAGVASVLKRRAVG